MNILQWQTQILNNLSKIILQTKDLNLSKLLINMRDKIELDVNTSNFSALQLDLESLINIFKYFLNIKDLKTENYINKIIDEFKKLLILEYTL